MPVLLVDEHILIACKTFVKQNLSELLIFIEGARYGLLNSHILNQEGRVLGHLDHIGRFMRDCWDRGQRSKFTGYAVEDGQCGSEGFVRH